MSATVAAGWWTLEHAAAFLDMSPRALSDLTRIRAVPHRRLPRTRRLRFREDELRAWMDGCKLEVEDLGCGGRVVRPLTEIGV
jgi:hypothetical protein